jgi:hypothetical protein
VVYWVLLLTGLFPLTLAWLGNRRTTLLHALHWCFAAWLAWVAVVALEQGASTRAWSMPPRHLALCLTACAGVAVLGARRPTAAAWNFVLLGLLAVMLLPMVEGAVVGVDSMTPLRSIFLAVTLAVGVLNYLPTRLWAGALLLAVGCGWEVAVVADPVGVRERLPEWLAPGWLCLAAAPWAAYVGWRRATPPRAAFDRLWWEFRNRYGLVWGQRVREQFNRAAAHAGWPVQLHWFGLLRFASGEPVDEELQLEMFRTLQGLLKRFGPPEGDDRPPPEPAEKSSAGGAGTSSS